MNQKSDNSASLKLDELVRQRVRQALTRSEGGLTQAYRVFLSPVEKAVIEETIDFCEGKKTKAAQILGISYKKLMAKIETSE